MHSPISVHTKHSVSLLWVCVVDAHTSPLATENQFNVHWTSVFTATKTISSISILSAAERKAMVPLRMNMRFHSLLPLHTYTLKREAHRLHACSLYNHSLGNCKLPLPGETLQWKRREKWLLRLFCVLPKESRTSYTLPNVRNQLIYLVLPLSCKALSNSLSGAWLKDGPSWGKQCSIKGHCCCIWKDAFLRP